MRHDRKNRKLMDEGRLVKLCREARARADSQKEEDLLFELLVGVRQDLGVDDPREEPVLPFGRTGREILINNLFNHFNYQYNWSLNLNISGTINRELLHKSELPEPHAKVG